MAADLDKLRIADVAPSGLEIRRVRSTEELRDFACLNAALWMPPDDNVMRFYELAALVLLDKGSALRFHVGYFNATRVATAELTVGGGVVGLYNISTVEPYRRRGFGTAMTLQPLLDARAEGYRTAVLQAAPDGVGVYRCVGFESFGQITEYKPPIHADRRP